MTLSELSVLVTLTTDSGKVLAKLHAVQPTGSINFIQGIKIAHVSIVRSWLTKAINSMTLIFCKDSTLISHLIWHFESLLVGY